MIERWARKACPLVLGQDLGFCGPEVDSAVGGLPIGKVVPCGEVISVDTTGEISPPTRSLLTVSSIEWEG